MAAAAAMMMSDDDDAEPQLRVLESYYIFDSLNQPACFSTLPLQHGGSNDVPECKKRLVLWGTADPGIKKYKEVMAWRLVLEGKQPEIKVLAADGSGWIRLVKPKNSYEETVRTVLITAQMLHFLRRKPDEPEKNLWSHLRKVFDKFDVRPSEDDFRNHRSLMKHFAEKDPVLAKSEILRVFVEGRSRKNISEVGADNIEIKQPFIADDEDIDEMVTDHANIESDEEDEDLFDSICAICDNGGDILCCDGPCMRSFHAKRGSGEDSYCDTLGYTEAQVEAMKIFLCKNCEYKQHQCFICGVLEPSDGAAAKVSWHCKKKGFMHKTPQVGVLVKEPTIFSSVLNLQGCVVIVYMQGMGGASKSSGCVFVSEIETMSYGTIRSKWFAKLSHWKNKLDRKLCSFFKNKICSLLILFNGTLVLILTFDELTNAVSLGKKTPVEVEFEVFPCNNATCGHFYHPKCVAKKLHPSNRNEASELEKKIPEGFSFTCPIHWCFHCKDIEEEDIITRAWELSKRILIYCLDHAIDSEIDTPVRDHIKFPKIEKPAQILKKGAKLLVKKKKWTYSEAVLDEPSKDTGKMKGKVRVQKSEQTKQTSREVSAKSFTENLIVEPEKKKAKFLKEKIQPALRVAKDPSLSSSKPVKEQEQEQELPSSTTRKIPLSSFPTVDSEAEKRVIAILGNEASMLTLKDVTSKCSVPSTHVYSGRQIDKIAQGKIERSVQAVGAALKKLENGGNINDAKAVCEPDVLRQLAKWHIVDKLHWYVEPGDTIVDFCCGANDFSQLMKEKLDKVPKRCHFKNYDLIQPKNHFCFEKRDWMTVQLNELPCGSQLIMGLNPPFGVKASLANKFIDKALAFKPKLVVLIVPKETKRLDQKKTPYDLIWEDSECLAGKAFYLPGSVDLNDKTVEGWNASAPPLYLWSRPDWTKKHLKIAEEHSHTGMGKIACHVDYLSDDPVREEAEPSDKIKARSGKGKENTGKASCHIKEDNLSDDLPVRTATNKWNSRSAKERDTIDKTGCNDRESNLPDDRAAKTQGRSEQETGTLGKISVHVKEVNMSDNLPVKKQTEPTSKVIPGKEKEYVGYESRSDNRRKWTPDQESLPPEKQVEVAYEETKVTIPSKKSIHNEQRGVWRENRRNSRGEETKSGRQNYEQTAAGMLNIKSREGWDSDMSISSPDSSNARSKSRSYSPAMPTEHPSDRIAHTDTYCPSKDLYDPMLNRATYKGSYLASNNEYFDELNRKKDTFFYADIDDRSRMRGSSIDEVTKQSVATPTSLYGLQSRDDGSLYRCPSSEHLNTTTSGRSLDADVAMQGHVIRYDGQVGDNWQASRIPLTTGSQTHLSMHGRIGADYLQARYSLGSSGAGFSLPSSTTSSFGLSGACLQRGSVMDKYGYGLSGLSGPQGSVMDKYAPSLDGKNNTRPENSLPRQYPVGRPGSYGGGWQQN
ncbi:Protein ENHANCED DOWNY MILDEW 2 [Dichanthelium oligosanthes]|uniref:Protein ENHANCED DOWNY MILDEW 2 n=1 Tax=Dichanthelium oligosanthes TaxID=888268 RepID=A0A1E5VAR3_9POAL|nr:Protein ENHANCED DOWNY MILDEW 2 [Dichanthelium oligosanthes]